MKKLFKLIAVNVLILLLIVFLFDCSLFYKYKRENNLTDKNYFWFVLRPIATKSADNSFIASNYYNMKLSRVNENENTNKKSIVFSGCSIVWGAGLEEDETISYQFSKHTKLPVYNVAAGAVGLNYLLFLVDSGHFKEMVKIEPQMIIYNWADFHLNRMLRPYTPLFEADFSYKKGKEGFYRQKGLYLISRFPLFSTWRERFLEYLMGKSWFVQKMRNYVKEYFIYTKKLLEKDYPNIKFVIIFYPQWERSIFEYIANDLEEQGFIIIRMKEDLGVDPNEQKYILPDKCHPTAEVWEIAVPKLYQKLKPYINE